MLKPKVLSALTTIFFIATILMMILSDIYLVMVQLETTKYLIESIPDYIRLIITNGYLILYTWLITSNKLKKNKAINIILLVNILLLTISSIVSIVRYIPHLADGKYFLYYICYILVFADLMIALLLAGVMVFGKVINKKLSSKILLIIIFVLVILSTIIVPFTIFIRFDSFKIFVFDLIDFLKTIFYRLFVVAFTLAVYKSEDNN